MDDYEGARGVPRVPRRPLPGAPTTHPQYHTPMYGGYDNGGVHPYPPQGGQGPQHHPPHVMSQQPPPPHFQQQGPPGPPPPHHNPPQQGNFPHRRGRDWDGPTMGDGGDFKRRRYPDSYGAPSGPPQIMRQPSHPLSPPSMYQQQQQQQQMPPSQYHHMGPMSQHEMPRHDIQQSAGHMGPGRRPMRNEPYPYSQPPPPEHHGQHSNHEPPPATGPYGGDLQHPPQHGYQPGSDQRENVSPDAQRPDSVHPGGFAPPPVDPSTSAAVGSTEVSHQSDESPTEPMTFKDFLAKQPDNISPQAAQEAYDAYVREFTKKQPNKFFDLHKDEEWFRERYDPKYVRDRIKRIEVEVQDRAKEFREIWDKGGSAVCAPLLRAGGPTSVVTIGDSPVKVQPPIDIDGDASDGKDGAEGESNTPEKEQVPSEVETAEGEVQGNPEGERSSGDSGTEQAKTLSSVSSPKTDGAKANVETDASGAESKDDLRKEANGGPVRDANDAEKEQSMSKDEEQHSGDGEIVDIDSPKVVLPLRREHQKDTIFMRCIPRNLSRAALVKMLRHGPNGDLDLKLRRLKLGDINPSRGLQRFGWAVYDSEETAARALELVKGQAVKSSDVSIKEKDKEKSSVFAEVEKKKDEDPEAIYVIDCMPNMERRRKYSEGRVLPMSFAEPSRIAHDAQQGTKIMRHLDSLRKVNVDINPLKDEFLSSLPSDESRLDHVVSYLREVHYFCYYSGNEFLEDPTSMPPQELRATFSAERMAAQSESDSRMLRRVDERAKWVFDRDYDRPRSNGDNGVQTRSEHLKAWLDANTKHEGPGRYRCGLPPHKLFKGPEFVHKHIRTKHAEAMQEVLEKADLETYRSNFENDASQKEVIDIYNQGMAASAPDSETQNPGPPPQASMPSSSANPMMSNIPSSYSQASGNPSLGMYGGPFMGMGVQFPMLMVPQAPAANFASGFHATTPYQNSNMGYSGQGMAPPMMHGPNNSSFHSGGRGGGRHGPDGRDGPPYRGGGRHGGHWRRGNSGYRGGRGGYGDHHREPHGRHYAPQPLDPRAKGRQPRYNDLDAPANGPSIDLVRYDDI